MTHDPSPREPLTPEEQALARRLAQLGPQAEPSSALDARVLAAARAASPGTASSARSGVRWPVVFGLAASMVLAVGIAWRLRPLPEPPVVAAPVAKQSPAPAARVIPPPPHEMSGEAARPPPPPPPPPPLPAVERQRVAPEIAAAPAVQEAPAAGAPAPQEAATTLDRIETSGSRVSATPAQAALPPAPPPAAVEPETRAGSNAMPARKAAAEQATEDAGVDAAAAADQAASDEPETEVPPATADSPEVRDAWLQRIRELAASGQTEAARASLKEFIRRHPDVPLPDDLRALSR